MFGDANCRYLKSENWIASNRLAFDKNIQNKHLCKENINIIKGSKLAKKMSRCHYGVASLKVMLA